MFTAPDTHIGSKLSQAKTTKGHAHIPKSTNSSYPPTAAFPKVELYITVKCKNIYRVTNNDNRKKNHTLIQLVCNLVFYAQSISTVISERTKVKLTICTNTMISQ